MDKISEEKPVPNPDNNTTQPDAAAPQAELNMDESGLGALGMATAGAGGVALGGAVNTSIINKSIKGNLAAAYDEARNALPKMTAEGLFTLPPYEPSFNLNGIQLANAQEVDILTAAENAFLTTKRDTHQAVQATGAGENAPQPVKDFFAKDTTLGKAREAAIAADKASNWKLENAERDAFVEKWKPMAKKIAEAADPAVKASAAEELIKTIVEDARASDMNRIGEKVSHISWARRHNPFGDLHLSGKQKALAVVAGTATAVVGALGIGKAIGWMSGRGDSGQER